MAEVEVDTKKLKGDIKLLTEIQCEHDWSVTDDHAIMVAKSEQVQTLRGWKGHPLSMMSANITDLEVAVEMFSTVFGDSARMLRARKAKLITLGKFPKIGSKVPSYYAYQIDWYLQMEVLIEGLQKLALDSKDIYCEIYKPSFLGEIENLFPYDMVAEMIGEFMGDTKDKMNMFLTYGRDKEAEVQGMLRESPGSVNVGSGSGGGPGKL